MIKLFVAITSTVAEPRTAATATTDFSGFADVTTFVACRTDGRCRGCRCLHEGNAQRHKRERRTKTDTLGFQSDLRVIVYLMSLASNLLTFAGLRALRPGVTTVSVAATSAVLVPSTAGSATADSAGFLEDTALTTP